MRGKVGDALRANLSSVVRNRELTELVRDVPLAQTPDTLRMQPWDRDQIHQLFDQLEFRVLRDRLFDTLAAVEPEVDEGFDIRGGALEPGTRRAMAEPITSPTDAAPGLRWSARICPTAAMRPRWQSPLPTAMAASSTPRR